MNLFFEAGKVISKEIMSPAEVEQIKNDFNDRLCIEDDWWERKSKSRYATLIPITHLLGFDPFVIKFKNRQAWLELYQPNQDDKELESEDVIGDEEPSVASKDDAGTSILYFWKNWKRQNNYW